MNEFLQFNIGQVAQIVVFVVGLVVLFQQVKNDVKLQNERLSRIELEVMSIKDLIVSTAKLEERIDNIRQTVIAQGKRLDRLIERVYGKKQDQEDECYNG